MKNLSDLIQILCLDGGAIGFLTWLVIVTVALYVLTAVNRTARMVLSQIGRILLKPTWEMGFTILFFTILCFCFRSTISDQWQYVEQVYWFPTYDSSDTSAWATERYESELKRYVSESEFTTIKAATARTAAAIGAKPIDIYEVAYSECGLNPFAANVNKLTGDTVAFGWIQFTRAGCIGLQCNAAPVNMATVKAWGKTRNVPAMMQATHDYLTGRANGQRLESAVQVYICIFAPAFCGAGENTVLYAASSSAPQNYWQNAGFDGYGLQDGKIIKSNKFIDRKITVQDLRLHLAVKKARFLKL